MFMQFHFYGLFYDMLINDNLKNEWHFERQNNIIQPLYIGKFEEYTKEEFHDIVKQYLSVEEELELTKRNYKI